MAIRGLKGWAMTSKFPWDYHNDLAPERLTIVARLIADGRHTAVELFDEGAGDNGWTLGCRAFQFSRVRILRAAQSGDYPWLNVIDPTFQLIFKIGAVPVRFYGGDAEGPTDRTVRQSLNELNQLSLVFAERDDERMLAYRFAVESDSDGSVLSVRFVGLRDKAALLNWNVPLDGAQPALGTVGRAATDSVKLPAPQVGIRALGKKDQDRSSP